MIDRNIPDWLRDYVGPFGGLDASDRILLEIWRSIDRIGDTLDRIASPHDADD